MPLQRLQQLMHVQRRIAIVEPDNQPERDEIRLERVDETAAKGVVRERPAQGMNHAIERLLRLPQLLDAECEDLGIVRRHALPLAPRLGQ